MNGRAEEELHQHPHRPALRPVRRHRDWLGYGVAADRPLRGRGRGPVRALLRAGVRVGADDLGDLSLLLGPQEPVGRAASRYEDPDPVFNQFLKAGYCRVSVPGAARLRGRDRPLHDLSARSGTAARCRRSPTRCTCRSPTRSPSASTGPATRSRRAIRGLVRIPTTLVHCAPTTSCRGAERGRRMGRGVSRSTAMRAASSHGRHLRGTGTSSLTREDAVPPTPAGPRAGSRGTT